MRRAGSGRTSRRLASNQSEQRGTAVVMISVRADTDVAWKAACDDDIARTATRLHYRCRRGHAFHGVRSRAESGCFSRELAFSVLGT